jgi:hypothetical protein
MLLLCNTDPNTKFGVDYDSDGDGPSHGHGHGPGPGYSDSDGDVGKDTDSQFVCSSVSDYV